MCKLGDIIVVKNFKGEDGTLLKNHSFIVIDDTHDKIKGIDYDLVAPIMSSFKGQKHKEKVLSYNVNKKITNNNIEGNYKLKKESYIKANKLYYFDKKRIKYFVLAKVNNDYLEKLTKFILSLDEKNKLSIITTNLQSHSKFDNKSKI